MSAVSERSALRQVRDDGDTQRSSVHPRPHGDCLQTGEYVRVGTSSSPLSIAGEVVQLPLEELEYEDRTFCFRMSLKVDALAFDIAKNGQDFPIVVRPRPDAERYQLICGFRRVTALKQLGHRSAKAIVKEMTDEEALRLSWSENERRKSYSALDRAHAILKAQRQGYSIADLEQLFSVKKSQLHRWKSLVDLPPIVSHAIDTDNFRETHAIALGELLRKYPNLDAEKWIGSVKTEKLTVRMLRRRVNRYYGHHNTDSCPTSVQDCLTDCEGELILKTTKVSPQDLPKKERKMLEKIAIKLLELVESSRSNN